MASTVVVSAKPTAVNAALHGLLVAGGAAVVADALTRLHAAAQTGGITAGLAAVAIAVVSWAQHSTQVAALAATLETDAGKLITPEVESRIQAVEKSLGSVAGVVSTLSRIPAVNDAVNARLTAIETKAPAPIKIAIDDLKPLVAQALVSLGTPTPDPVAPVVLPVDPSATASTT